MARSRSLQPWLAALRLALGIAVFIGLVWWLGDSWERIAGQLQWTPWLVVGFAGTSFTVLVTARRWQVLTEHLTDTRLGLLSYVYTLAATRILGQFIPMLVADFVARPAGLRAAGSRQPFGTLALAVVLERILDVLLPIAVLVWVFALPDDAATPLVLASFSVTLALLTAIAIAAWGPLCRAAFYLQSRWTRVPGPIRQSGERGPPGETAATPTSVALPRSVAVRLAILSTARYIGLTVQFWAIGAGVGVMLSALEILSAAPIAQVGALVGLTPGGLGLQESGWAAGLMLRGVDAPRIALFVIAARLGMVTNLAVVTVATWPWRRPRAGSPVPSDGRAPRAPDR